MTPPVDMGGRPRIAITMGDAAGIGPEIIVKSLADPASTGWCVPLVIGDVGVLERAMDVTGVRLPIRRIARAADASGRPGTIDVIAPADATVDLAAHRWGEVNPAHGEAAVRYTREAGRLAVAGEIDAMVSAPLNKEAMHAAGHRYEGQTEILGELTGTRPAMLLLLGRMRLMLFTNHMALRAVCDFIRTDRILDRLVLADAALRDMGIPRPRLAVAGLNPHAGEEGAFGHEERAEIVPAIRLARERGIDAQGPFPADTVFLKARDGVYDLTLALYHDQGLMAVKLLGFGTVVTLLVGLPLVRTSTGHGTAFDIAGRNVADHRNLLEAIRVAAEIAAARRGAAEPGLAARHGRVAA
jgi:4-phospho-D-threonate 3-dehydrogenase / 4-phospho-D-erythronate 3-dehydrogenase